MTRAVLPIVLLIISAVICNGQEPATTDAPVFINDGEIRARLLKEAERLLDAGKTLAAKDLTAKTPKARIPLELVAAATLPVTPAQLYQKAKPGVLLFGGLYKCEKCSKWHVNTASGFVIGASGVAVTAYHVLNAPEKKAVVAMTSNGDVLPIKAILAASELDDVAIVQLDGAGLTALPLRGDAPVGTKTFVIHHPDEQYYTLTGGLLSRYSMRHMKDHRQAPGMVITAEFAKGSSGAPVFDEQGNVIGLVCSTRTIYYSDERKDPQMVIRDCAPSASVLKLLAPAK